MKRERYSKFRGVYKCGKKWKAQIQVDGVQHYLGVFNTEEEASVNYLKFAAQHGRALLTSGNDSLVISGSNEKKISLMKLVLGRTIKEASYLNLYVANILSGSDFSFLDDMRKDYLISKYVTMQKKIVELQHFLLMEIFQVEK